MTAEELQAFRLACVEAGAEDVQEIEYSPTDGGGAGWYVRQGVEIEPCDLTDSQARAIVVQHFEDELVRLAEACGVEIALQRNAVASYNYYMRIVVSRHALPNESVYVYKHVMILSGLQALKKWRE